MSGFGLFQPAVLAMESQTYALSQVATNIANVQTPGYKRTDVQFSDLMGGGPGPLASSPAEASPATPYVPLGGVFPVNHQRISLQGIIEPTGRSLDAAINGDGFFILNPELDGSGAFVYGRDGGFTVSTGPETVAQGTGGTTITVNEGYLVDGNGYYVFGWPANPDGTFPTDPAALTAMRVDTFAFHDQGQATTAATLWVNLPADQPAGWGESYVMEAFDGEGDPHPLDVRFVKGDDANTWSVDVASGAGDVVSLVPPTPMTFSPDGHLLGPQSYGVSVAHADGSVSALSLDVSGSTQYAGSFAVFLHTRNGFPAADLQSLYFEPDGDLIGVFDNGMSKPLYRLGLADFPNADGLDALNGNVYALSTGSGLPIIGTAGTGGFGSVVGAAREQANVDLTLEFSRMITTQGAYNAAANAFRTLDEMTETARDLKA